MPELPLTSSPVTKSTSSTLTAVSSTRQEKEPRGIQRSVDGDKSNVTKVNETPDPPRSIGSNGSDDAPKGRNTTSSASRASELANLKVNLRAALRQFPNFPSPGILFEDILPIFADPALHAALIRALEYSVEDICAGTAFTGGTASTASVSASMPASGSMSGPVSAPTTRAGTITAENSKPDVIVGLEARGFLFGPALALRLGAAFVPVRKKGKLPGPVWTASYVKEYGEDVFEMQQDAIKAGQRVLVVDDIIATGKNPNTFL